MTVLFEDGPTRQDLCVSTGATVQRKDTITPKSGLGSLKLLNKPPKSWHLPQESATLRPAKKQRLVKACGGATLPCEMGPRNTPLAKIFKNNKTRLFFPLSLCIFSRILIGARYFWASKPVYKNQKRRWLLPPVLFGVLSWLCNRSTRKI